MNSTWYCGFTRHCLAPGIHQIHNEDILICVIAHEIKEGLAGSVLARLKDATYSILKHKCFMVIVKLSTDVVSRCNYCKQTKSASCPMVLLVQVFFKIATTLLINLSFFPHNLEPLVCVYLFFLTFLKRMNCFPINLFLQDPPVWENHKSLAPVALKELHPSSYFMPRSNLCPRHSTKSDPVAHNKTRSAEVSWDCGTSQRLPCLFTVNIQMS